MEALIANYLIENNFEDLKGYEGLYKINKTELWSCYYNRTMVLQENEGYLYIALRDKDHKRHKCYFHRLLAIQYIENPNNYLEVDHIDRNRSNNSLENLRWADKSIQNNNKSNCVALKTEEEQKQRIQDIKEYKRLWAEKDRREKGIQPKNTNFDKKEYSKEWMANKRASMSEEEKQKHLERRRELYRKNKKLNQKIDN